MWLVLDIGNSAVKGGFFEGEALQHPFRLPLPDAETTASWEAAFEAHLAHRSVTRLGIASVVPSVLSHTLSLLDRYTAAPAERIHHGMRLPFTMAYATPHTLGADRLAAAAAAWARYRSGAERPPHSVVALDAGTAVTCEVVDRSGVYLGGIIGAGPYLLREALTHGTAQLPAVPLELPPSPIGGSTLEALQAGIMYAFIDSVHGMLGRIRQCLNDTPVVVATGGWRWLLKTHLGGIDHFDPHLVLHGIRVLMALNDPSQHNPSEHDAP